MKSTCAGLWALKRFALRGVHRHDRSRGERHDSRLVVDRRHIGLRLPLRPHLDQAEVRRIHREDVQRQRSGPARDAATGRRAALEHEGTRVVPVEHARDAGLERTSGQPRVHDPAGHDRRIDKVPSRVPERLQRRAPQRCQFGHGKRLRENAAQALQRSCEARSQKVIGAQAEEHLAKRLGRQCRVLRRQAIAPLRHDPIDHGASVHVYRQHRIGTRPVGPGGACTEKEEQRQTRHPDCHRMHLRLAARICRR